jgi:hypothetical protein
MERQHTWLYIRQVRIRHTTPIQHPLNRSYRQNSHIAYIPQHHNIDKDDPIKLKNPHSDSLYAHTQKYVNEARKKQLNPNEYIAEVTGAWVSDAQDKNHNVILSGDFNKNWTDTIKLSDAPIPPNLRAWATSMNLIHPAYRQRRKVGDDLPHTYHKDNQHESTKR